MCLNRRPVPATPINSGEVKPDSIDKCKLCRTRLALNDGHPHGFCSLDHQEVYEELKRLDMEAAGR